MNETSNRSAPAGGATVVHRGLVTLAGWYVALVVAFVVLVSVVPDKKTDGSCDGIGFGCTPNPRDGLLIVGVVFGLPFLLGSLVVAIGTFAVVVGRFRSGPAAGTVAVLTGFAVAAAVPLIASFA